MCFEIEQTKFGTNLLHRNNFYPYSALNHSNCFDQYSLKNNEQRKQKKCNQPQSQENQIYVFCNYATPKAICHCPEFRRNIQFQGQQNWRQFISFRMRRAEKILAMKRKHYTRPQYLVKWEGKTIQNSTWHHRRQLKKIYALVDEFDKHEAENTFAVKTVNVSKSLQSNDESQNECEEKQIEKFVLKDRCRQARKVVQILERKQENKEVSFFVEKSKYHTIWVSKEYLLKQCPMLLVRFYECYFIDSEKTITLLPDDFMPN